MANLCKSAPISFAHPNPSRSCSIARDRTKRRKLECSHPVINEGKYLLSERAVDDDHSLPFGFLSLSMRLSHEYADRMRETNTRAALGLKKLHLILDLDHTLLHTVRLCNLTLEEKERLKPEAERNTECGREGSGDIFLVGSETGQGFITKLGPSVREFLREADVMFELTIYTMGGRPYASRMTKLLDSDGQDYSNRVITREDCTLRGRKSFDVVLAKESNVPILDDTATVWPDHAENLISIEPYAYFSRGIEKQDVQTNFIYNKGEPDSVLSTTLQVFKYIHGHYFDPKLRFKGRDVRGLVRKV